MAVRMRIAVRSRDRGVFHLFAADRQKGICLIGLLPCGGKSNIVGPVEVQIVGDLKCNRLDYVPSKGIVTSSYPPP